MAINPVLFARTVNEQFLRYQLTAFPLTDERLARQAEAAIRETAGQPGSLIKGPYLTLSRAFKMGPSVAEVVARGILHPAIASILEHSTLFAHQWETVEAVRAGRHCLVSTGTSSGKTEAFLMPILDHCLRLRDRKAPDGVVAVIVYPMNALAVDQLGRLRRMLVGTGISFGMYVGSTAADEAELENVVRMKPGEGKTEFARYVQRHQAHERVVISPPEERLTEREMAQRPPPEEAADEVASPIIERYVDEMAARLQEVVTRLDRRMTWARETQRQLLRAKERGLLDEFEERLLRRCEAYLKDLVKPERVNYTLTALAVEGFLPGYGTYEGGVRAAGRSMEPLIHDGDYLVFRSKPVGSREGKVVLVQYRGPADPETGGAYTVKQYHSEKAASATGEWRHTKIVLRSRNPEYPSITLEPESEDEVRVIGEFIASL